MSKTPAKLSVETVVVCDEVRHEDTGKTILIGAYNHNMVFKEFPAQFSFRTWVQFKVEGRGKAAVGVRFKRDEKQILSGKIEIPFNSKKNRVTAIVIPTPIFEFKKPSKLKIDLQLPGKRWQTIKTIEVEKAKSSP